MKLSMATDGEWGEKKDVERILAPAMQSRAEWLLGFLGQPYECEDCGEMVDPEVRDSCQACGSIKGRGW